MRTSEQKLSHAYVTDQQGNTKRCEILSDAITHLETSLHTTWPAKLETMILVEMQLECGTVLRGKFHDIKQAIHLLNFAKT